MIDNPLDAIRAVEDHASIRPLLQTALCEWRTRDVPGAPLQAPLVVGPDALSAIQVEPVSGLLARILVLPGLPGRGLEQPHDPLSASWTQWRDATDARAMEIRELGSHGRRL